MCRIAKIQAMGVAISMMMMASSIAVLPFAWAEGTGHATGNGTDAEVSEAKLFFAKVAKESSNPYIAAAAQQTLLQLNGDKKNAVDAGKQANQAGRGNEQDNSKWELASNWSATPLAQSPMYRRQVKVPLLSQMDSSLAVPALINDKTMATLVVDTGATYTVITPRLAKKLGIVVTPDTPRISIITANGVINAPKVRLASLAIGTVKVDNVEVVIQSLGSDVLLAGLLGMNFFKDMDLAVRQNELILGLR